MDRPRLTTKVGIGGAEIAALVLAVLWAVLAGVLALGGGGAAPLVAGVAVVLPLVLIAGGLAVVRGQRALRTEVAALGAALSAAREGGGARAAAVSDPARDAALEKRLAEIAEALRETETALALLASHQGGPVAGAEAWHEAEGLREEAQPGLALVVADPRPAPLVGRADLIRALNFPDTEDDAEGFAALKRALDDRLARQLIQASQDVLTLLSQDGIYMDDLRPDRARPEIWRRFAHGERGRVVADLGGVRDRQSLTTVATRMREDTIFRDAAHHFLRRFDQMLLRFEPDATDEEIVAMSDTRTARAFMLLGRVTGTFD